MNMLNLSSSHTMHSKAAESGTHCSLLGGSGGITNAGLCGATDSNRPLGVEASLLPRLPGTDMLDLYTAPADPAALGESTAIDPEGLNPMGVVPVLVRVLYVEPLDDLR